MKHVYILAYLLSLLFGAAAFSLYTFIHIREKSAWTGKYLRFLASYTVMIALASAGLYYFTNTPEAAKIPDAGLGAYISVILLCAAAMIYTLSSFFAAISEKPLSPAARVFLAALSALSLPALAVYWFGPRDGWLPFVSVMSYMAVFMAVACVNTGLLIARRGKIRNPLVRNAVSVIIVYFLLSSLSAAAEGLISWRSIARGEYPGGVLSMPLFYLAWNLLSILFAYRYYFRAPVSGALDSVPEAFIAAYGITPKEAEVASMVLKGKSNKEIASNLGVSVNTVRNHVYNIFQKTGLQSRTELINGIYLSRSK